jgi:hypothetical protein
MALRTSASLQIRQIPQGLIFGPYPSMRLCRYRNDWLGRLLDSRANKILDTILIEEGTQGARLYDLIRPHMANVVGIEFGVNSWK